jgi:hypothetical protein
MTLLYRIAEQHYLAFLAYLEAEGKQKPAELRTAGTHR